ncbi:MAG TPA: prolyl aminopeptidase [Patescibacteria group bacterium]
MEEVVLKPYKKGFLDVGPDSSGVGKGHKIYYEACGNPKGKPILYVHGGPGAGFSESSKKYFDPDIWNIILFEQRGSGRSTPFASLENNTTDDLVDDINKLLNTLKIEKVTLFGGSWGSTLSLVYAIRNRHRVNGMVLRGIFIPSKEDNRYFFGGSTKAFYPEIWERFISLVPKDRLNDPEIYYYEQMQSKDPKTKEQFTFEWAFYETSILKLKNSPTNTLKQMGEFSYKSLARLEAHYLTNNCFIPDDYILKEAHTLSGIPTYIIHGRYDMICRPVSAYLLHKEIKDSKLFFTTAGHSSGDIANKSKLLWALKQIYPLV